MRITKNPVERKQEIMDTARQMFIAEGYSSTSVDSIVRRLGVAKGLFYYYFRSKEELMESLENEFMEEFHEGLKDTMERRYSSLKDMIAAFIDYYLDTIEDNMPFIAASASSGSSRNLRPSLEGRLKESARSLAMKILSGGEKDFTLTYPEHTLHVLVSGFADLYLSGLKDRKIFLRIAMEILGDRISTDSI